MPLWIRWLLDRFGDLGTIDGLPGQIKRAWLWGSSAVTFLWVAWSGLPWEWAVVSALAALLIFVSLALVTTVLYDKWTSKFSARARRLKGLSRLLLKYEQVEREAVDPLADIAAVNRKQTGLHNASRDFLAREMGEDFYAQFKVAKHGPPQPLERLSLDRNKRELLQLIRGRLAIEGD